SAKGFARASTVSFTIEGGEARLFLGTGSFNVTGRRVLAEMASPDLLVFKSVPTASTNKAEWRAVLDAISAGQVVAELDLVATSDGHWMEKDRKSTRLNSSHDQISYAVFCLKKKKAKN